MKFLVDKFLRFNLNQEDKLLVLRIEQLTQNLVHGRYNDRDKTLREYFPLQEKLAKRLSCYEDFSPELLKEKDAGITPELAKRTLKAHRPNLGNKIKALEKISIEKLITFFGYFFPKKFREEAKGDIFETRYEMMKNGCSKKAIFCVTVFKIVSLILGSLRIRLSDLAKPENEVNK